MTHRTVVIGALVSLGVPMMAGAGSAGAEEQEPITVVAALEAIRPASAEYTDEGDRRAALADALPIVQADPWKLDTATPKTRRNAAWWLDLAYAVTVVAPAASPSPRSETPNVLAVPQEPAGGPRNLSGMRSFLRYSFTLPHSDEGRGTLRWRGSKLQLQAANISTFTDDTFKVTLQPHRGRVRAEYRAGAFSLAYDGDDGHVLRSEYKIPLN